MKEKEFPEVRVMNYLEALKYVYRRSGNLVYEKYAIISIQEPTNGYGLGLAFQKGGNCLAALNIEFSDATPAIKSPNSRLMSKEDAWNIHNFVEKIPKEVELLIIHCQKGRSRSAAVAAAILFVKTGNNEQIFGNQCYTPNQYVYYTLLETYGKKNDYWERCYEEEKKLLPEIPVLEKELSLLKLYKKS